MQITMEQLTLADLDAVDDLMKRHSRTLGFLPREALQSYLMRQRGGVLGAKTNAGQLVGYLLYAANPNYFRITHLCVLEECRGQGVAKRLVNGLKDFATTQRSIKLNCRRDFPANDLWPKLGFVALANKRSRSRAKHFLTIWHLTLGPDDQLDLFQAITSNRLDLFQAITSGSSLDVVIDAQIFFDFDEPDSAKTKPSKVLLSDFLIDSLNLLITDEIFNEIDRQDDPKLRNKSRNRAHNSSKAEYNSHLW